MIPKKPFQFEKEFEVLSFQINPSGKLRWASLGDLLQETAWKHADSRGFGQKLFELGLAWVLSRLKIKVIRMPSWGEKITVKTAGRGIHKIFAVREFEVCDKDGNIIAEANSSWLLLNMENKRPQRPAQVLPKELFEEVDDPSIVPAKLSPIELSKKPFTTMVRASDLDMNNHVNNVSYIRWIEDFAYHNGIDFERLNINYVSEAKLNDHISLHHVTNNENLSIQGMANNASCFVTELLLSP